MQIQTDRALLPAHTDATRYLTVTITAPGSQRRTERLPVNVALVLDRSGSMGRLRPQRASEASLAAGAGVGPRATEERSKLDLARTAVAHAIRLLDARDHLAVVSYDHEAHVVLQTTPATPEARAMALARLEKIDARGNTNLSGGWSRGMNTLVDRVFDAGKTGRVLLLTDGLANEGVTDHDELADMVRQAREHGVTTSSFGLGADFDETLLARLATDGGGHFYFIESPRQIADFLTSELGETLDIVAPDAELIVDGSGLEVGVLNDLPARRQDHQLHIALGDLVSGQEINIGLALRWEARAIGAPAFVDLRLTDRAGALFPQPMRVDWTTVDAGTDAQQPVNRSVLIAVAQLIAAKASAGALGANRLAFYDDAVRMLRDAVTHLREMGRGIPEIEALAERLERDVELHRQSMEPMLMKARHLRVVHSVEIA
jgi:Ca-activated chloride channel family protein